MSLDRVHVVGRTTQVAFRSARGRRRSDARTGSWSSIRDRFQWLGPLVTTGEPQIGSPLAGWAAVKGSSNPPQRAAQCRLELPGSLSSNSGALTGNSARRAGGNSPRRSGRRPGLRREPAPGSARSSFARFEESAHAHGEPLQVRAFEAGMFAASSCSPFSCSDATVRPRVCVQILSS